MLLGALFTTFVTGIGRFFLKDAVGAGTNAVGGNTLKFILDGLFGRPPLKWLPQACQDWMKGNAYYSAGIPLYGWPDGNTWTPATKMLFDDAG